MRSRNPTSLTRGWYGRAGGAIPQKGRSQGGGGLVQELVGPERCHCVGDGARVEGPHGGNGRTWWGKLRPSDGGAQRGGI